MSEDIEVGKRPLLENGRFAGDYEFKLKGINGVLIFFCCSFALLLAVEVLLLFYGKSNALAIKLLLFSIIPLIALLALIYLLKIYIPRSYQKMTVKSLEIGSFDLVINDESIPFSKIQKIEIDDPYLTNTAGYSNRNMIITTSDSDKPRKFILGERPPVQADKQDPYIALYNSIVDLCSSRGIVIEG